MILGTKMATSRDITQIIPALFRRLRLHERMLKELLLRNKYLTSEIRRIRMSDIPPDQSDEWLAALEWQKGAGSSLDPRQQKCLMGLCDKPQGCPFRIACEGSTPTPSSVAEVFPAIPTESLG